MGNHTQAIENHSTSAHAASQADLANANANTNANMAWAVPAPWHWAAQLSQSAWSYGVDAWQRSILYADVRRQRGNQYHAHQQEAVPNVLSFPAELVMSGLDLPRPVNYALVRITTAAGVVTDPSKRPFVVVDPRAGHGPGIGGFKPDSEIGAALKAGHPCYFIGFTPEPTASQSVEDVMHAEAAFVRKVAELHPEAMGKPAVIGNCQAGWQILMTAAVWPELFGPIIVAGAPVSYWAGNEPMRYAGGLLGGSWLTALTSDIGHGRFDGAWLVQNFENLNPANTLWTKQYNLYAKVDTEGPRYLEFERYWGGYVFLNGAEIQYIVDKLFIGNQLATAQLRTQEGQRIDLRNIRSPIVVFCSYGDNITPPAQALGWITDLYRDDTDVLAHDQTIVYATHDSIGHLGIFVSGSVGRKEHREFAANIDIIDLLPAGIFHAQVEDHPAGVPSAELDDGEYLLRIERSGVQAIRDMVQLDQDSERRFAAAARISEINLALYRNLWQPWVRAWSTSTSAQWAQAMHPMRLGYEHWSDRQPLAGVVKQLAETVLQQRQPVATDTPFWQAQTRFSDAIVQALDQYRDQRDAWYGWFFDSVYGAPAVQALAGQSSQVTESVGPVRPQPCDTPEHQAYLQEQLRQLEHSTDEGGLPEAVMRALCHIFAVRGEADGRHFRHAWDVLRPHLGAQMQAFRHLARSQAVLMRHHSGAALAAIPQLLRTAEPQDIRQAAAFIADLAQRGGPLTPLEQAGLLTVQALFAQGLEAAAQRSAAKTPAAIPDALAQQLEDSFSAAAKQGALAQSALAPTAKALPPKSRRAPKRAQHPAAKPRKT